jgi:acyl dehydratase
MTDTGDDAVSTHAENAHALYSARIGQGTEAGEWLLVDQARITAFGEVTEDRQYIHVDPEESAKRSPYKVTIAHGFLTLSLAAYLVSTVKDQEKYAEGVVAGLNYGFDKVRFLNPVKVDSRIRALVEVTSADLTGGNTIQLNRKITIEIEGETKPALVAEWLSRRIYG